MPTRKQAALSELRVGILVTIALFLLALFILQQNWGLTLFSRSVKAITYLPDVGGLKPGAPVWLAGIEIGKVRQVGIVPPEVYPPNLQVLRQIEDVKKQIMGIDPKMSGAGAILERLTDDIRSLKLDLRIVEVQLEIRRQYINRVSKDSEVSIGSKGLIGDSFIEVSSGTYGVPPDKRGDYYIIEGLRQTGFKEIMTGANDVIANFGVLSTQFKNIAARINPDQIGDNVASTIGSLQTTLQQATRSFDRASLLMDELRQGKGTIGRLVADPKLYDELSTAVRKLNETVDRIQQGNGTLPKLINDPALYDHATSTLRKAEAMVDRIEKGEGTLGRLSKDAALYDSTRQAIDRFAALVEKMERGDGTIGKLLRDPSLYNNLNQSTAEISKLIYDLRQDPKKFLTIRFRLF
jgi:phospholipid/cholesterol/gamma-HCH transport system substrate-binding protein